MHMVAASSAHLSSVAHHAGQYYCSGSCYQVSCATLALLKAQGAPALQLSAQAKAVLATSHALVLAYATPVAFSLLPCASLGA